MADLDYYDLMNEVLNKFPDLKIDKYDSVALQEHKMSCIKFKIQLLEIDRDK